jgi:hypothetical protein
MTFDGNPALAFQVHVVEQLGFFFAGRYRLRGAKQSIGEGAFSVINMGNNAKISNVFHECMRVLFWANPCLAFRVGLFALRGNLLQSLLHLSCKYKGNFSLIIWFSHSPKQTDKKV